MSRFLTFSEIEYRQVYSSLSTYFQQLPPAYKPVTATEPSPLLLVTRFIGNTATRCEYQNGQMCQFFRVFSWSFWPCFDPVFLGRFEPLFFVQLFWFLSPFLFYRCRKKYKESIKNNRLVYCYWFHVFLVSLSLLKSLNTIVWKSLTCRLWSKVFWC